MKKFTVVMVLAAAPCGAMTNQLEFSYGRGVPRSSLQLGNGYQKEGDRGGNWSAAWLHPVNNVVMSGIGGGHFHSGDDVSPALVPNAASALSSRATSVMLLGRVNLTPGAKSMWYIIAGVGWVHNTMTLTATPATTWSDTGTSEPRVFIDSGKDALAFMQGIGLEIPIMGKFFVGGEARYQTSTDTNFNLTPAGTAATGLTQTRGHLNMFLFNAKVGVQY